MPLPAPSGVKSTITIHVDFIVKVVYRIGRENVVDMIPVCMGVGIFFK